MISAHQALNELQKGNRRFVSNAGDDVAGTPRSGWQGFEANQRPFAIVLGCSDSRVPPERIFDQGMGDLFVVRVAGNVATPSQVGSIEFAVEQFGTRLVVVLGHTGCGAVRATVAHLRSPEPDGSDNLRAIIDDIRPSIEPLVAEDPTGDGEALSRRAVRAHVGACAGRLRCGSSILAHLIAHDGLVVVGAEYALETGLVDFFDGVPAPA